jgi:hypothetical protein
VFPRSCFIAVVVDRVSWCFLRQKYKSDSSLHAFFHLRRRRGPRELVRPGSIVYSWHPLSHPSPSPSPSPSPFTSPSPSPIPILIPIPTCTPLSPTPSHSHSVLPASCQRPAVSRLSSIVPSSHTPVAILDLMMLNSLQGVNTPKMTNRGGGGSYTSRGGVEGVNTPAEEEGRGRGGGGMKKKREDTFVFKVRVRGSGTS